MQCVNCKSTLNKVIDTAHHHREYTVNRGKHYLWKWAHGRYPNEPFVARQRVCLECNYKFRTIEMPFALNNNNQPQAHTHAREDSTKTQV